MAAAACNPCKTEIVSDLSAISESIQHDENEHTSRKYTKMNNEQAIPTTSTIVNTYNNHSSPSLFVGNLLNSPTNTLFKSSSETTIIEETKKRTVMEIIVEKT